MSPLDRLRGVVSLLSDPRVPRLPRLVVIGAVLYLLWPVDLVPEIALPLVGWLDDVTLLWMTVRWMVNQAKRAGVSGGAAGPQSIERRPPA